MDAVFSSSSFEDTQESQAIYRKFTEATQEHLRLSAALQGFFMSGFKAQVHQDMYCAYLRRRIRPAMEQLIEQEDTDKMAQISEMDWLNERLTDEFIQTAQTRRKPAALVWLLQMKEEKYGFHDRDFSL